MVSAKNLTIGISRVAAGGDGIGVDDDGRVIFVPGSIPGDQVEVEILKAKKRFATARLVSVIEPSPGRQAPPCDHVAEGCGGCDWQHARAETQSELRRKIVTDALVRIGRLDPQLVDDVVESGPPLSPANYRTTVRALVAKGRAGYRKAESHEPVLVSSCLIAHPLVEEIITDGRFPDASEVLIRVGANTGERMVVVSGPTENVSVPGDVAVVSHGELERGKSAFLHEEIDGKRFRISAQSFFQCRPDGAKVLADLARGMIGATDGPLLDAYCGVGLFGSLVGEGRPVTGVELNPHAVADAQVNLPQDSVLTVSAIKDWEPSQFAVVIADPARAGLGAAEVGILAATRADVMLLVSCDPASLGRDAGLLTEHGYELRRSVVVDMFGHTSHVECVSHFTKPSTA